MNIRGGREQEPEPEPESHSEHHLDSNTHRQLLLVNATSGNVQ